MRVGWSWQPRLVGKAGSLEPEEGPSPGLPSEESILLESFGFLRVMESCLTPNAR